jgi:bacterioferritin (cytochrome b1)
MVHDIFNDIFKQHGLVNEPKAPTISLEQALKINQEIMQKLNEAIDKAIANKDLQTLYECNLQLEETFHTINQLEQQIKELDNVN